MRTAIQAAAVRVIAIPLAAVLASVVPASAQTEDALRSYFEGKRVTLKIDMPGTSDGVDVRADASRALDYREYGERLKRYGTAIHSGESTMVTLVKMKRDLIEFQLGGGGFGTFSDDTSTSVYIPLAEKSSRERDLEKLVKDEDDPHQKRELQRELDDLRRRRERENRRIEAERERQSEIKKERIAEQRLRGGSRFNIRYNGSVPAGIRPEDVMAALGDYVDFGTSTTATTVATFSPTAWGPVTPPTPVPSNVPTLRKGLSRADVEDILGRAWETSERHEGNLAVATLVFVAGDERITAEFVEDVLVRYSIMSK
jgi:hypothetical protein